MAKFTDYTEKTEPVDTDLALIYDTPAKVNKKFTFGNLWKWIAKKIVSEGISQLDTTNKTIPGAINELNSKRLCLQQIYGEGKYKDCNDLPIGESAIAFSSALNKPDSNIYFIFCVGSIEDKIKTQYAIKYVLTWNVRTRIYDFNNGTWSNWN